MAVHRTWTFRSGNSEAIRLPEDIAFGEDTEVILVRAGNMLTIYRAATTVTEMVERLRALPPVPEVEQRDLEELPERLVSRSNAGIAAGSGS